MKGSATNPKSGSRHRSKRDHAGELESRIAELNRENTRLNKRNEQLERENKGFRTARQQTEGFLQEKIRKLEDDLAKVRAQLETANKTLSWFRKNHFGRKSEQGEPAPQGGGQDQPNEPKRKRSGHPGNSRSDRSQLDTEPEIITAECNCPVCGKEYKTLDRFEPSSLIELHTHLTRLIYLRAMYVSACECEGKKIFVAPAPKKLFPRTEIGNSLWVRLVVQKFLHGVPTNRTLKELKLMDFPLAAGTVVGGFKHISRLLDPLVAPILQRCQEAEMWNADETTWRVLDEEKIKWWMWIFASKDAVVYVLDPSRSKSVPTEFFANSMGTLMTDRFSSYKALSNAIRKAYCWVHVRRDFLSIFQGIPSLKPWALKWLLMIGELFALAHKRFSLWQKDVTSGEEWEKVCVQLDFHVSALTEKWQSELNRKTLHKEQAKVLRSLKRHWAGLTLFMKDPCIPLHNNRAERLLRNLVCIRKNSLGSGSAWSGSMCAKLCSLIQTWLINGLNPQSLLREYFDQCAENDSKPPPDISQFIPWTMTETQRKKFLLPDSYQKPG